MLALLIFIGTAGFPATFQVTNSGATFSPAALNIHLGDSVNFSLASVHNAVEVDQATWNANGTTPLPGGFETPLGGGLVLPAKLTVGIHYYVCTIHASLGMKGTITVLNNTGIGERQTGVDFQIFPNPAANSITIHASADQRGAGYLISSLTGNEILHGTLESESTLVDVSQLKPGIYMVAVTGQKRSTLKLIKN